MASNKNKNEDEFFGFHKEPKSLSVGEYSFKAKVEEDVKEEVKGMVATLCNKMERISRQIGNRMKESCDYKRVQEVCRIPSVAGKEENGTATAFFHQCCTFISFKEECRWSHVSMHSL